MTNLSEVRNFGDEGPVILNAKKVEELFMSLMWVSGHLCLSIFVEGPECRIEEMFKRLDFIFCVGTKW